MKTLFGSGACLVALSVVTRIWSLRTHLFESFDAFVAAEHPFFVM